MILKSLEMQGFKSFPDKIKIEFGNGITAIVGPNGSGKSNISDAIRWVMGEQSTKTLRGSKMEDVIFTGTTDRRAQGFAEVSLTIDNTDKQLDIEYSEVTVSRRYYRSGESEYFINRNPARLRDINELFMDTGLGRDGYSIIGQGKIAEILSPKSDERRQIIEEVAGISKYRYRKNEAERKLAATDDNLVRLTDIVGELSERLPALKGQSDKAKQYLSLYEQKKEVEVSLWVAEIDRIKESAKSIEENYKIAKGGLDDITVEIDNIEGEINKLFEKNRDINIELEQIRTKGDERQKLISDLKSQLAVLDTQIEFENQSIKKLTSELSQSQNKIDEIKAQIDQYYSNIETKKSEITQIDKKISELYEQTQQFTKSSDQIKSKITLIKERINQAGLEKNELNLKLISIQTVSKNNAERLDTLNDSKAQRLQTVDGLTGEISQINKDIKEKEAELESENNSVSGYREILEIRTGNYEKIKQQNDELLATNQQLNSRIKVLSDMEKHLEGFSGSVKIVLEQARQGTLQGIIGPVSKLLKVDSQYITAIETALGASIQNIVTDSSNSAKNAMLLLKNRQGGRATFLPIDNLSTRPLSSQNIKGTNYLDIANNLISIDSNLKAVADFLLGRVVVCGNISDAIKLAKANDNRFKIVTLDGQVINAGGSMTGGSVAKSAGLLTRGLKLENLKKDLEKNEQQIKDHNVKLEKSKQDKALISAKLEAALEKIHTLEQQLANLKNLLENKQTVLKSHNELLEQTNIEIETLTKSVSDSEIEQKSVLEKIAGQELILSVAQGELDSLETETQADAQKLENIRQSISECDVSKQGLFKDIESIQAVIEQLKKQLNAYDDDGRLKSGQIESSKSQIENYTQQKQSLNEQIKLKQTEQQSDEGRVKELIQSRQSTEAQQSDFRKQQRDKMNTKEKLLKESSRLESKLSSITVESDRIVEQLLEYELTVSDAREIAKPIESFSSARKEAGELKKKIKELGSINIDAIDEYDQLKKRYDFLFGQVTDLKNSKQELEKIINELLKQMRQIFSDSFEKLNHEFSKSFSELFGGGKAELILSDPEDVLGCDIDIRVAPPGKIIKNLLSLSGGEQAFSAIALYFAILKIRPTPFCVVDEIEAALDDVNVLKFAARLRDFSDNTQFIVITHRRGTMEEADVLYGVTMQEKGISKLLTINVNEMERQLKL